MVDPCWGCVMVVSVNSSIEKLRGFVATPSGAKIPVIVTLKAARHVVRYSHVGQVSIPQPFLDEFEEEMARFYFRGESGECFTQLHVIDEYDDPSGSAECFGRIILLRDADLNATD